MLQLPLAVITRVVKVKGNPMKDIYFILDHCLQTKFRLSEREKKRNAYSKYTKPATRKASSRNLTTDERTFSLEATMAMNASRLVRPGVPS